MDESRSIFRLEIEGHWSAEELGNLLIAISDLYAIRLYLEILYEDRFQWMRYYPDFWDPKAFPTSQLRRRPYGRPFPWWLNPPPLGESQLSRISQLIEPEGRLEVRRVDYASPGIADLAGIGVVVGHVKDFVFKLLDRQDTKRSRELDDERAALENERLRIENARNFVALASDLGYNKTDLRSLVLHVDGKQDAIIALIEQKKLRGISYSDDER